MDVRIIKIEGSVELAPLLGLADGIVDIVETGTTLKENGSGGHGDHRRYLGASHRKHRQP